MLCMYLSLRYL